MPHEFLIILCKSVVDTIDEGSDDAPIENGPGGEQRNDEPMTNLMRPSRLISGDLTNVNGHRRMRRALRSTGWHLWGAVNRYTPPAQL